MRTSHSVILVNGNILTLDSKNSRAEALAVANGRIAWVGANVEIRDKAGQGWESIDLQGKTVLPGFIDSHVHFLATALTAAGIDLSETRSIPEILEKVYERTERTPSGEWILGFFITHLSDRGMPTRYDLDRITTTHPVRLFHRNGHLSSLNTKALEILKVPEVLDGVERASGEMTGVVRDPASLLLPRPDRFLKDEVKGEALKKASASISAKGVTTLHALDGGPRSPRTIELILKTAKHLPIKIIPYDQTMVIKEVLDLGLPRIGGCICADGAFESHTAALFEPYADEPDNYGALTYSQQEMTDFISHAHQAGLQAAIHCEGDRAIEQVLSAYEKALRDLPRDNHRHRIEHFEIPTENQIERVARAGIMPAMQPSFLPAFFFRGGVERYEAFFGRPRLKRIHPYRTMIARGIFIAGGSDSPVTPVDPLAGIEAAATHPHPDERIPVLEAIKMFTVNGARFAFEENEKGTIEVGRAADLVVLSEDPCNIPPSRIGKISVEMTILNGEIVFRNTA